ncbi:beta-ketoacyl-[acyl-carrier-protein] synthase family protein [Nocardiopsis aegyptia]|uniref:3-oxoacyl-[acyl-carrier-protein] synthase II n=1 Tax=Nocardiopsis aegyptia TaxID=220378 RepID=A0A7Z0JBL1_9ACTN|nr:beta-ketoacyl-[acyl-carrier-protein] synthase family protein [Nocardiopsis aegyptia]NYJ35580.1 3-oxoacyl-[acyl-carrier-protein] synthase II [Nocardiopsis aegyptia]
MTGNHFDAVVTGLGLLTPAGIGVADNTERIWSGVPTAAHTPALEGLPVDFSCEVPGFDPVQALGRRTAARVDRVSQLGMAAAREAVADAGLDHRTWDGARVAVVVGTSFGGAASLEREHDTYREHGHELVSPLLMVTAPVNMTAGYIAMDLGALGPNQVVSTACASGATAVGYARLLLRTGACDIAIAGGSEAALTPTGVASLAKMGALSHRRDDPSRASRPFDADRDGFVAGEGAGMLVLERLEDARARGARVRARISGFGASADGHHPSAPDPTGSGAERAVRAALADGGVAPAEVGHVNAHGTSTPLNDVTEAALIRRVYGEGPAVTSTKGVIGHLIGAAGAVETAYTVLAVERGVVPPTANLDAVDPDVGVDVVAKEQRRVGIEAAVSHSFGFGGQNAAVLVTAP